MCACVHYVRLALYCYCLLLCVYRNPAIVTSLLPSVGPTTGGTPLILAGAALQLTADALCRFTAVVQTDSGDNETAQVG
jgi:hypothetical protein